MLTKVNEKVSVLSLFDRQTAELKPVRLKWQGREYTITKLGMHHTLREGRVLHHIFSVTDGNIFFCLDLDTEDLSWTLKQTSDGMVD